MSDKAAASAAAVQQKSARGVAITIAAQIIRFVMTFGSQLVLVRLLDAAQFGLVAMAAPVLSFVQTVTDFGLGQAVVQRTEIGQPQLSALFWVNTAISAGLALVVVLLAPALAWLYSEPQVTSITVALGSLVLVGGLSVVPSALLNRRMNFGALAVTDVLSIAVGAAVSVIAALEGVGVWALVLGQASSSIAGLLLTLWFARWRPGRPRRGTGAWDLLRFGAHLTGANLATYLSVTADRMLIGVVIGKVGLGTYDRSYRLVLQPLGQLLTPLNRVAIPTLSRLVYDREQFEGTYLAMLRGALLFSAPLLIVNIVAARPIVSLLFGSSWVDSSPVFAWVSFGAIASALYSSTGWVFTSQGNTRRQMTANAAVSLLNVASLALGLVWGIVGVAAVSALSFVFLQTPFLVREATREGLVTGRSVLQAVRPFVFASAPTALILYAASSRLGGTLPGILACELLSYSAFFAAVAMQPGGRQLFRSLWSFRTMLKGRGYA